MTKQSFYDELIASICQAEQVEAVLLAGSRAGEIYDEQSDYDLYIYCSAEIPLAVRREWADRYCSYMEVNNQFWETEDDGVLKDGIEIELIYRTFDWMEQQLERILVDCQPSHGYTTCFWHNLMNSKIIFDKNGKAGALLEKSAIAYPLPLKANIIKRNRTLLKGIIPSYFNQVKKALLRNDQVSVNHRLTEFVASYFDILFALNEQPHPGEKRLVEQARRCCRHLPNAFESNLQALLGSIGIPDSNALAIMDEMITELDRLLAATGNVPQPPDR